MTLTGVAAERMGSFALLDAIAKIAKTPVQLIHQHLSIAAISEQVTAESRETEDTADWIGHATAHYDSSTDSEDESQQVLLYPVRKNFLTRLALVLVLIK